MWIRARPAGRSWTPEAPCGRGSSSRTTGNRAGRRPSSPTFPPWELLPTAAYRACSLLYASPVSRPSREEDGFDVPPLVYRRRYGRGGTSGGLNARPRPASGAGVGRRHRQRGELGAYRARHNARVSLGATLGGRRILKIQPARRRGAAHVVEVAERVPVRAGVRVVPARRQRAGGQLGDGLEERHVGERLPAFRGHVGPHAEDAARALRRRGSR